MKEHLLLFNHAFLFFGITIYTGMLWALRFFFYGSWRSMNVGNVQEHFVAPIRRATAFFTIVAPLMFVAGVVMVVSEWGKPQLWQALASLAATSGTTFVFQGLIRPLRDKIAEGLPDDAALQPLLKRWMVFNDIRFVVMTIGWIAMMWYFAARGGLVDVLR